MKNILVRIVCFCIFLIGFQQFISCKQNTVSQPPYYLVYGENASEVELNTISDLKEDLSKVIEGEILLLENEKLPSKGTFFILGTPTSNGIISSMINEGKLDISSENPGPRGGIWSKQELPNSKEGIVISGSDVQGLQYAIYDFSKEILGVDHLEYWTGKLPAKIKSETLFNFENRIIPPPQIPHLSYFENDVDELANYRGKLLEYDWESYTELINSLVRLRYNSIQLFDMLGRPEFFIREEYKKLKPDYQVDRTYIDKMIDYAHQKGMKIAVDFALGYQINPIEASKATCWSKYKEDWLQAWRHYLEKTPLKKTDMFILRPRHQVWDWEYKSTCGENKIEVFNEVYAAFDELIEEYKPNAEKILVCYDDGMQMWNEGFRPPEDWIVAWSDNGFSGFDYLPETTDGYDFGTYMHAGFWLNHTVHNPYPEKMDTIMKKMLKNYGADKYCLVNGQQFRPFLLNIEGFSEISRDVQAFDGELFYKEWTERYFNEKSAEYAVKAMKKLHDAQFDKAGYVEHLWEIRQAISYLSNTPIIRPGRTAVPYEYGKVSEDYEHVEVRLKLLNEAKAYAEKGLEHFSKENTFYHDYVLLPIYLYLDLLGFEHTLHKLSQYKRGFESKNNKRDLEKAIGLLENANEKLENIYKRRLEGDKNDKWKNWYNPDIRRPNNGFPSKQMMEAIENNLFNLR